MGLGISGLALGNSAVKGDDPGMMVSPQTIVLAKISTVTVHTNIPATTVAGETVTLDGAPALDVWADDCGDLAARFAVDALGLEPAEAVELTLAGTLVDPETGEPVGTFEAKDTVRVK
jgi:hypothetical protein